MRQALEEARKVMEVDSAHRHAIVKDNKKCRAHNLRETLQDATAHAELWLIEKLVKY